jgi:hypothetical protein
MGGLASLVLMPETPMNKDHSTPASEYHIWSARQVLAVQSIPVSGTK